MNAGAAQKKAPDRTGRRQTEHKRDEARGRGPRERLHDLPVAAGAAIMVALLVAALFAGNFRALQRATPKAFLRQGDVKSIMEDRIDAAHNVLTVAGRAKLDELLMSDARAAMEALETAKTAREISRADQALRAAISELTTAQLGETDARSMTRAADAFAETGSMLRQEARAYDERAAKAERLYDSLPTRFALPEPDRYEGL